MKKFFVKKEINKRYPKPTLSRKFVYKLRMFYSYFILFLFKRYLINVPFRIILSSGRTGTRSVGIMLNQLEYIISRHEPRPAILPLAIKYLKRKENEHKVFKNFLISRSLYLVKAFANNLTYIESNHTLTFLTEMILKNFKNVKVIFITRDPVTYLQSAYSKVHGTKNKFNIHSLFDENDKRERIIPNMLDIYEYVNWEETDRFEKICWNYRVYHDEYLRLKSKGHVIPLYHFEELFTDKSKFVSFLNDLDLKLENSKLEKLFESFQKPLNSSQQYQIGDYSSWSKAMRDSFKKVISPVIKNL
jgi:hypothetical protein